jgi:hypothetical protein
MSTMTRPHGIGTRTAHDPGDPLVTSHCPFCGSGQVVGRSDGTISCDFCGQSYIVRVQPAFPGMPQMPMGPGAPSDVGPDGGLVDPGMVGPDGMPADGDGPPPGDSEPGGGPFEGPDDGDAEAPPGDDDDSGPPPPPKGKSKKKSALLGVQGQRLTEEQFVRHMAVVASGADPRVMARMRAEGAKKRVTANAQHYRTLSTGHQVSIGRHGSDWYGTITHPASSQIHYMHLGQDGDPRAEAERQMSGGTARSFIHATGDGPGGHGMPERESPSQWWNTPNRTFQDTPFHSASRRPFAAPQPQKTMSR